VVYTPRDGDEVAVCRSLFWISYNFSLNERSKKSAEWNAALKYERKSASGTLHAQARSMKTPLQTVRLLF